MPGPTVLDLDVPDPDVPGAPGVDVPGSDVPGPGASSARDSKGQMPRRCCDTRWCRLSRACAARCAELTSGAASMPAERATSLPLA